MIFNPYLSPPLHGFHERNEGQTYQTPNLLQRYSVYIFLLLFTVVLIFEDAGCVDALQETRMITPHALQ